MGDTTLPQAGPTYGSSSTMGVGAAVYGCAGHRRKLATPRGTVAGRGRTGRRTHPPPGPGRRCAGRGVAAPGRGFRAGWRRQVRPTERRAVRRRRQGHSVRDAHLRRDLRGGRASTPSSGSCASGAPSAATASAGSSIPRTARAQMTGAIIWGWGMAAMEASHHEPTLGRWLSKNLAGVAIPVNADIPCDLQIHFVDEFDAHASPLGAQGHRRARGDRRRRGRRRTRSFTRRATACASCRSPRTSS